MKRIYLLDGTASLFRAFYAIRHLSSPEGHPTNATFGFTQMLRKLLSEDKPEYLAVAFDRPEATHRHQIFTDYKANRPAPPEDLVLQIKDVKRVCEVLGVPVLEAPGFEADDLIGTVSRQASEDGFQVTVVASDKDLLQLVDRSITVLHPVKGERLNREGVRTHFGVYPEQVVEVLALMGDSSDNIPGVPGIGEKGAKDLIRRYGNLEGCLEHAEEIKRKAYRENLVRYREQARMSRELARIRLDAPVSWDPAAFIRRAPVAEEARRLFEKLGFERLLPAFQDAETRPPDREPDARRRSMRVRRVRTLDDLGEVAAQIARAERLALVPHFSESEPMRASLVELTLAWDGEEGAHIPLVEPQGGKPEAGVQSEARVWEMLGPALRHGQPRKLGEDLKAVQVYLLRRGFELGGIDLDTTLAGYLLDPEARRYSIEALAGSVPGTAGRGAGRLPGEDLAGEESRMIAAERGRLLLDLEQPIRDRLEQAGLSRLYHEVELPLLGVLAEMERTGVRVDTDFLAGLARNWNEELGEIEEKIFEMAGERFNIQSPPQLREILFTKLGLKPGRKTEKEKSYSTGVDVLEELARKHPLPAVILEYRSLAKLLSTYAEALPKLVHPDTERVHTSFNQTAAATGRLSSSHPNLQNIPVRTEQGRQIRRAFVGAPGWRIVTADYSQIELRVLAHLSGDEEMVRAFRSGEDIHTRTAAQIFGVAKDRVTSELRRQAKAINFGILYGMGPFRLGRELGVSLASARRFIESYFERFSGVKSYVDEVVRRTEENGHVATLFGRIRPVPEIRSRNANLRRQGIRVAVNTAVQGTAADLIKMAMIKLHRQLRESSLESRLVLQVHDELLLEAPEEEVPSVAKMVKEAMEKCHTLDVPLVAEVRSGCNWLETS